MVLQELFTNSKIIHNILDRFKKKKKEKEGREGGRQGGKEREKERQKKREKERKKICSSVPLFQRRKYCVVLFI